MTRDRSAVIQSGQRTHPTSSFPESRQMLDNNLAEFSLDEMAKDLRADNNIATPSDIRTSSAVSAEHRPSSTSVTTTMAALHSEMRKLTDLVRTSQTTGDPIQSAKPPDSLPMIPDMVTPALRRQIVEGKLVNLAELLIPNSSDCRLSECDGQSFAIKDDNRLNKTLTQGEFHSAFLAYKKVLCEAFPGRSSMMDAYQHHITDMAAQYGGTLFYEYHKMFAAKAAAWMAKGVLVDWGLVDTRIYTTVTSGYRSSSCGLCHSLCHLTDFCPQMKFQTSISIRPSPSHPYVRPDQLSGGQYQGSGRGICNNFNNSDIQCFRGKSCRFRHACLLCKSPGHGQFHCKQSVPKRMSSQDTRVKAKD